MINQTQLSPGSVLQGGKYKVEAVLGQGGFGITYLAEQVSLDRKVAIKEFFMKEYCNRDSDTSYVSVPSVGSKELVEKFKQKFIKEAKLIAGLDHPHIIRIYDVFEENGTAYYVMEYLGGGSLSSYVESNGRLLENEAVGFIRQVGSALSYIHGMNINHLDVKPGNILLDKNGRAVLIDFGLSKRYDETGSQTSSTPVGISHGYAPLEQYKAGGVGTFSPTTDIYSLGATLFKLVTGQTPPDAMTINSDGFPTMPNNLTPQVRGAMKKSMQPRPKDRIQSVAEFLSLLDEPSAKVNESTTYNDSDVEVTVIDSSVKPNPVTPPTPLIQNPVPAAPKPSKKWLIPVLILVGILLGVGIWWLIQSQPEDKSGKLSIKTVPDAVEAILDGKSLGVTPLQNLEVSQGSHTLELKKEGYESVNESITIGKEALSISKTLQEKPKPSQTKPATEPAKMTKLYVTTTPSGATVSIDGKKIGVSPINGKEISLGSHTVRLTLEGYEPYSVKQNFGEEPVDLNVTLTETKKDTLKEESAKVTKLYVTTTPSGATVSIDGKQIGVSPINGKEVSNGSHTIKISFSGYEDYVVTKVFSGDPVIVNESLKSKPAPVQTSVSSSSSSSNKINGYEYVDLGLSVKWATKNVGASSPSDYGDYYAWGETRTKVEYKRINSLTYNKKKFRDYISGNPNYDVARKKWGSSWRLPTKSECEELVNKCTWKWTTEGGHKGYRIIGPNGKSIFLPAAGFRDESFLVNAGEYGLYWSSTPDEGSTQDSCSLRFYSNGHRVYSDTRSRGHSVRPVSE